MKNINVSELISTWSFWFWSLPFQYNSQREVQCQFSNLASSDVELGFIITSFLDSGGTTTAQIRKALKMSIVTRLLHYAVGELKDWTKRNLWSKTTLVTSSVCGAWVAPPFWKIVIFFLRSLVLSMPIYRNFQSNRSKWRSLKLWTKKFI